MRVVFQIVCALMLPAALSVPCSSQVHQPSLTYPEVISMCEDSDGCSDWLFKAGDGKGTGQWASGGNADLTITHLDAASITVHREDRVGPVKGIVVDYTGTISNFWIDGDVSITSKEVREKSPHCKRKADHKLHASRYPVARNNKGAKGFLR